MTGPRLRVLRIGASLMALAILLPSCSVKLAPAPEHFLWGEGVVRVLPRVMRWELEAAPTPETRLEQLEASWARCEWDKPGACDEDRVAVIGELDQLWQECRERFFAGMDDAAAQECAGIRNRLHLIAAYSKEWAYNHGSRTQPPLHAVALSGGGLRAASFAIGYLSGLDAADVDRIDAISAVSGGSYAASWLYLQQAYCGRDARDEILDHDGEFQKRLASEGDLESRFRVGLHFVANLAFSPVNLLLNGVFGTHWNTTPSRRFYEWRLEDVFHQVPDAGCGGFRNGFGLLGVRPRKSFDDLRRFAREEKLPYLIINATGIFDDDRRHRGARLSNTAYELGFERWGTEGFGFHEGPPGMNVVRAVAISGAALDSSLVAGSSQRVLISLANEDLGYYIDNPRTHRPWWKRLRDSLVPFPFYFLDPGYGKDAAGHRIYLTDGGHSENLGAYNLIKRVPWKLTIIDGEHDPCFKFNGYWILKEALLSELGVNLFVPQIENGPDNWNAYENPWPVMRGTVERFPMAGEGGEIEVEYVKLSLDSRRPQQYGDASFWRFYQQHAGDSCSPLASALGGCPFPQQSTTDQDFQPEQFDAYRDLGIWIAQHRNDPPPVQPGSFQGREFCPEPTGRR